MDVEADHPREARSVQMDKNGSKTWTYPFCKSNPEIPHSPPHLRHTRLSC